MLFAELAGLYEKLDATTKRLEIRELLAGLLTTATPEELPEILFLSQGQLRPEYEGVELGVADSLARRAVAEAAGADPAEVARRVRLSGDLGTTAEELLRERGVASPTPGLSVAQVYEGLRAIARAGGEGSQEAKVGTLVELVRSASPTEAKYLVRFVLGRLRLGVREMTILDALASAFGGGSKESRAAIEGAFNLSSDLGEVAQVLASAGPDGLSRIGLTVGRPIRPMLAEREATLAEALERMDGHAALELKYDGLRIQAHLPTSGPARLFSRRLEEIGGQFPELLEALPKAIRRRPAIVEGECVALDPDSGEIAPFQVVSRRRGRKHDLARAVDEFPVVLVLFDLLLDGSEPTFDRPFPERRARLESLLAPEERVRLAEQRVVDDLAGAQAFFDHAVAEGAEGVMLKSIGEGSRYRAGARGFWWIKYKRDYTQSLADSIDGAVVGAFHGRGRRAGGYGALLVAVYNRSRDRFESFCKVGSGFDDATVAALPERLRRFESEGPPEGVDTGLVPDRWMRPGPVLEVRGAELSLSPVHRAAFGELRPGAGLALRFPRFTGVWRTDRSAADATTSEELVRLYRTQIRRQAEAPAAATDAESVD